MAFHVKIWRDLMLIVTRIRFGYDLFRSCIGTSYSVLTHNLSFLAYGRPRGWELSSFGYIGQLYICSIQLVSSKFLDLVLRNLVSSLAYFHLYNFIVNLTISILLFIYLPN